MSMIVLGLPLAIVGGIAEIIAAHIRRPRVKVFRHKARSFEYYWEV